MKNWLSTDWLILRPLLVVAIVWATILAGLVAARIRKLMTARWHRALADPSFRQLASAGTKVARPEIDSDLAPPCSSASDRVSRAA